MGQGNDYAENVKEKINWEEVLKADSKGRSVKVVTWDFRDRDSLKTYWFSDAHLGHNKFDEELFKRNIERVYERQMPWVDLGDLIENATRNSVGAGVYTQNEIADAQMTRAVKLYTPIKHLGKVMQPGNHELRTFKDSGVNLTRQMALELGIRYGGAGVVHYILVGGERYVGYSLHGASSATTVGGKFNSLKRAGDIMESDFTIMGHMHDTIYHSRNRIGLNRRNRTIIETKQHLICNGSYLDFWGSYGQAKSYTPGSKGNAQITFWGDKRQIEVSFV